MSDIKWLDQVFTGGLIDDVGVHNFPINYSSYLRNIRILNNSMTVAPWFYSVYDGWTAERIQALESAEGNLYAVYGDELYEVDISDWSETQRSSSSLPTGERIRILPYGKYLILLTGAWFPFVWDIGTSSRSQLTTSNIETGANPRIWETYLHLTFVAWGGSKENNLYISRGITKANPEYAYDWTGTWSEILYLDSRIKAIRATEQRLYVFTEKSVMYIDENALQTTSIAGQTFTYPKIVSKYNAPASNEAVVIAHDRIFAFTDTRDVVEVNRSGVSDIEVANISDREWQSIRGFLQELDEDQSECVGYFDQEQNIAVRHLKTDGSPINNITLIYDLKYNVFLVDDSKFFWASTYHNNKLYTGSFTSSIIYRDGHLWDYDGDTIPRERNTETDFWDSDLRKTFTDLWLAWQHNSLSEIKCDLYVDDEIVWWPFTISWESVISGGIGTFSIGEKPIAGDRDTVKLKRFLKTLGQWDIRSKWYRLRIRLYGESFGAQTVISKMWVGATVAGKSLVDAKI